jgi:hypothetical protein
MRLLSVRYVLLMPDESEVEHSYLELVVMANTCKYINNRKGSNHTDKTRFETTDLGFSGVSSRTITSLPGSFAPRFCRQSGQN